MESRLRVLHVIPSVGPLRGGPSTMVHTLARGLAGAGVDVAIATTDDNGPGHLDVAPEVAMVDNGVTYRYFRRQARPYTFSWPLTQWLSRHIREYDVVHIHALFSFAALPAAYWARRYRVPYVVRPLGTLNRWGMRHRRRILKRLSFALLERLIIAGAAVIHYTSEQERLEAAELGVRQRSAVIPPAVEIGADGPAPGLGVRGRYPQLAGRPMILFLSRLDQKKGLDLLLPAFRQVLDRHPEAMLVVAGNGDRTFEANLKLLAGRLGIAASVLWTGFLPSREKWQALAEADVFVLPSYSENFGLAVVEAMAAGCPVVISDQVAIYREVAEANAGVVVPCRVPELAAAVSRLISDPALRLRLGAHGRALAQRFSPQAVTGQLVAMYAAILRQPTVGQR